MHVALRNSKQGANTSVWLKLRASLYEAQIGLSARLVSAIPPPPHVHLVSANPPPPPYASLAPTPPPPRAPR